MTKDDTHPADRRPTEAPTAGAVSRSDRPGHPPTAHSTRERYLSALAHIWPIDQAGGSHEVW